MQTASSKFFSRLFSVGVVPIVCRDELNDGDEQKAMKLLWPKLGRILLRR
jgi:hypothetical protein